MVNLFIPITTKSRLMLSCMPGWQWVYSYSKCTDQYLFVTITRLENLITRAPALKRKSYEGLSVLYMEVSKGAKIRNRYNQVLHLTQDTFCIWRLINIASDPFVFHLVFSEKRRMQCSALVFQLIV